MKQFRYIMILAVLASLVMLSCNDKNADDHDSHASETNAHAGHNHEDEGHSITLWQDSLEIFAEWDELQHGVDNELLVHVTDLRTYKAVTAGTLTVTITRGGNTVSRAASDAPVRPGIFKVVIPGPENGEYDLVFSLARENLVQQAIASGIHVGAEAHHHDEENGQGHEHGESDAAEDAITFLKEQQWQMEFATTPVELRTISDNIRALGEIKATSVGEAEVFAPFDGVLMPDPQHGIVRPGQQVTKGEILARIAPSGGSESGWTQLVNDYRLAKAEYERVNKLAEEGAVSIRRLEQTRLDLENKRSRVHGALGDGEVDLDALLAEGEHFHLRAPASGVITHIHLRYGQHVQTGDQLFNIIDPTRIWLEAQVPVSESYKLDQITDATFAFSGSDTMYRVSDLGGRLLTVSRLLDSATRRVPVIFELQNTEAHFRPGSFAHVYLKTRSSREALAVPESAVLDEDGTAVVYVQLGGEEFARRVVSAGAKDDGFVEIKSGLEEGERVVIRGAYKVRLASMKINTADAHAGHGH